MVAPQSSFFFFFLFFFNQQLAEHFFCTIFFFFNWKSAQQKYLKIHTFCRYIPSCEIYNHTSTLV